MLHVLPVAVVATAVVIVHLTLVRIPDDRPAAIDDGSGAHRLDLRGTIASSPPSPACFGLIAVSTINIFLGGVFMALLDAYGLSLVSVEVWGLLFGVLSAGFRGGCSGSHRASSWPPRRFTAFLISPIAQFVAIPFMTTGAGGRADRWLVRDGARARPGAGLHGCRARRAGDHARRLPHALLTGGSPRATSGRPPWPDASMSPDPGSLLTRPGGPRPRRHPRGRRVVRLLERCAPQDGATTGGASGVDVDRVGADTPDGGAPRRSRVLVAGCATALLVGVGEMQRAAAQTTAVALDTAAPFAVLASGSVTGTGTSSVTGDVGGSSVTGLNNQVNGTISTSGDTLTQARADMNEADDTVASAPVTQEVSCLRHGHLGRVRADRRRHGLRHHHARRRGRRERHVHLQDRLDAHHRRRRHREAHQRCEGVQRVLARREQRHGGRHGRRHIFGRNGITARNGADITVGCSPAAVR